MNKKRREYICTGALMAVGIPLMVIMTKLSHEICVQGKSAELLNSMNLFVIVLWVWLLL